MKLFLAKRDLIVLVVVLVLFCVYFIAEYISNSAADFKQQNEMVEHFQSVLMTQNRLDKIKENNKTLFTEIKKINNIEQELVKVETDISRRFVIKKVTLENVIGKPVIFPDGRKEINRSATFDTMIQRYTQLLTSLNKQFETVDSIFNMLNTNIHSKEIYLLMQEITQLTHELYEDKLKYVSKSDSRYIDFNKLVGGLQIYYNDSRKGMDELISLVSISNTEAPSVRDAIEISNTLFKDNIFKMETTLNKLITLLNRDIKVNRDIKDTLIKMFKNKMDILRKMLVRNIGFNLPDIVVTLVVLLPDSRFTKSVDERKSKDDMSMFQKEKEKSLVKSNGISRELGNLLENEDGYIELINAFFTDKSSFIVDNNEFKYFNSIDKNNNSMIHFCKKIRKMDRPDNKNMMFKRLSREFIKKKNKQIDMLSNSINDIVGNMEVEDVNAENLYKLRTSEDAQLQMNAIKRAKDNIENAGKFKININ